MIDVVDYEAAVSRVVAAARDRRPFALTALAVHGVMTGVQDRAHAARLNSFDLATPDGQPVRWALNLLHRARLNDRVYGPTLTQLVLDRCSAEGLPVYLYGSTEATLERLEAALTEQLPTLKVVGSEPSKFRLARLGEPEEIAKRIRDTGARLVLVGLGCPRQEQFVYAMRPLVDAPLLAVGAAFDYHAGTLRRPPPLMQQYGLEWLWRLALEPRRLWRRYVLLNPAYLARLGAQLVHLRRPNPPVAATEPLTEFAV
ncbi:UDP-N-acetyl-D-mannosaminuronic acid transferase [Mycobacterium sp. ACS1612]|uniref:WecB/TagA/CpsF family glycosyltransferase n=1 Tax=Mycobacterium sp. ACS1612 TaxID=1834117 RepID=UPI000801255F|nr:WecB/TagA/CpsF family glycosyltransferase [Mycobacterium sp. ACS1612]OBF32957.1 UDP-N-acetyl-D-mannosaminuronic acid transferase [Mycobacterium sp. ACS1612]